MAELYNLGIGLSVIDTASKPVRAVDAALASMTRSTDLAGAAARAVSGDLGAFAMSMRSASGIARDFDTILSGNSVDDSLRSVGAAAEDTTEQTAGLEEQLASTADQGQNLADISDMLAEQLAAQQNISAERHERMRVQGAHSSDLLEREAEKTRQLTTALGQLSQSLRLVGTESRDANGKVMQMRDSYGRFTTIALDGSIDSIAGQMANVVQKSTDLWDTLKGSSSGFKMLGNELGKVANRINETVDGFASLKWLGESAQSTFLDFGDASQKLAVGFGGAAEDAYELRSAMLDVGLSTQYSLGEVTKLTGELAAAGVDLRDMANEERDAFVGLNHTFNVSGQDIAAMSSTMNAFGGDMLKTLDDAAAFQKGFGIQGVFEELPGIIGGAQTAVIQFGDAVSSSVPEIVRNVTHTAGVFAKAYGKTMRDAVQSAQADFIKFVGASRQHQDVFLGLADGFDPLQEALMEAHVPLMRTKDLMDEAQKSPLKFASSMRSMTASMTDFQKRRFTRQLQLGGLSDDLMGLITNTERYNEAILSEAEAREKEDRAVRTGIASFKELNAGMLDTVSETKAMWENVKELSKAFLAQTGLTEVLKNTFAGAKDVLAGFSEKIRALVESDEMRAWGKTLVPVLSTVGKWFLLIGSAAGGVVGALGSIAGALGSLRAGSKGLKMLGSFAEKLPGVGKAVGVFSKGLGSVTKLFGRAIPGIGQVVALFSGVTTALRDMGTVMGDPNATGMQKFQALVRGTLKGVGGAFNSLLLGIPGWIADKFFPNLEAKFDRGIRDLFDFDYTSWLGKKLDSFGGWFLDNLPDWKVMAREWGKTLGGAMGGLAEMAVDALIWGIKNLSLPGILYNLWQGAFTDGMKGASAGILGASGSLGNAVLSVLGSAAIVAKEALVGIAGGFVGAFGTSLDELGAQWDLTWLGMKEFFHVSFLKMGNGVMTWLVDPARISFALMRTSAETTAVYAKGAFQLAFAAVEDAVAGNFTGIRSFVSDTMSVVGGTIQLTFQKAFAAVSGFVTGFVSSAIGTLLSLVTAIEPVAKAVGMEDRFAGAAEAMKKQQAAIKATAKTQQEAITKTEAALKSHEAKIKESTDDRSEVDKVRDRMAADLAAIGKERETKLAAIEAEAKAREGMLAGVQEGYAAERAGLDERLFAAQKIGHEHRQNAAEAAQFQQITLGAVDAALVELGRGAKGAKFDGGQSRAAEEALRGHMDASLRSLTKRIAEGEIEMDAANKELQAAESKAIQAALKAGRETQRKAGDVAGAAKGKGKDAKTAAEKKEFQSMMAQFTKSLAANRRQMLEVRFSGSTGDAIGKALAGGAEKRLRNQGTG